MDLNIVGAGHAGLIAAQLLNRFEPVVWERQPGLPENHHSVLRMETLVLQQALGIPLKKVNVLREIVSGVHRTNVAASISYSYKNTRRYRTDRSLVSAGRSQGDGPRYIYDGNLTEALAKGVQVQYGEAFDFGWDAISLNPVISTMPMPALMNALGYENEFGNIWEDSRTSGIICRSIIPNCDVYATVYYPDPSDVFSRIHINGEWMFAEIPRYDGIPNVQALLIENIKKVLQSDFGIKESDTENLAFEFSDTPLLKISPIDESERLRFIRWATTEKNVYSLGRYATWRPGLRLEHLVQDVRIIQSMIEGSEKPAYEWGKK